MQSLKRCCGQGKRSHKKVTQAAIVAVVVSLGVLLLNLKASADTLSGFLSHSKINGYIRSYYFSRDYSSSNTNQSAFALGGMLNLETAPFLGGFGAGITFWSANSLGANDLNPGPNNNFPNLDATLMGTEHSINTLGQAYLQFKNRRLLIRGGDQMLNTPWMSGSDSRLIPATYQAVYVEGAPTQNLKLIGFREFRWKSRTSSDFFKDNLFYQPTYNGDDMWGGAATLPASTPPANGTLAFGASYQNGGASAETWYYKFYNFADMIYWSGDYSFKKSKNGDAPFIGAQYVREWSNNNSYFPQAISSTGYGVLVGLNFPKGNLTWSYNGITTAHGSTFHAGGIFSPYTAGYATDPMYTTSMTAGLVEKGAGNAWKLALTYFAFQKKWRFITSYAQYNTEPFFRNTTETDMDITYFPKGRLDGLSIRDRIGIQTDNPTLGTFLYNRVMLEYDFSLSKK